MPNPRMVLEGIVVVGKRLARGRCRLVDVLRVEVSLALDKGSEAADLRAAKEIYPALLRALDISAHVIDGVRGPRRDPGNVREHDVVFDE